MAQLNIISAGAAQSVVMQVADALRRESGQETSASFGAVGAQKARVLAGEPADVIILTRALIDELTAQGSVVAGTSADLGGVGLGIAVRAGMQWPDMRDADRFRANLLAADAIFLPDPKLATAGIHLLKIMDRLGLREQLADRLRPFPNGNAAMNELARSRGPLALGITMITEIRLVQGVELVAPLPGELQSTTTYCAAIASGAANPHLARDFMQRLTGPQARQMLADAGFEI